MGSLSEEGVGPESRPSQGREGKGRWAETRAGKRPVVCFFLGGWGIWVNFTSFILFSFGGQRYDIQGGAKGDLQLFI